MDTAQVAEHLGTTPRILRAFLRSPQSTFVAVGSGARYDFTDSDLPTLLKRFLDWRAIGTARPNGASKTSKASRPSLATRKHEQDRQVWTEEGEVKIPDIRDPRVRARVKRDAQEAEERLHMMLLAAGLHITQPGFDTSGKAS